MKKLTISILLLCILMIGYFVLNKKTELTTITLSGDKKSIISNGKALLSVDDDYIFNWFKNESQLCDSPNIETAPDRRSFCQDKVYFKKLTHFSSISISPNKEKIGFTIVSDTLSPDSVVGIFSKNANTVNILTNYYLGNEFISFSPDGNSFVYKGGCWEAICVFYIKDSETMKDKIDFIPKYEDMRGNYVFIRWLSKNSFEYKVGDELKEYKF